MSHLLAGILLGNRVQQPIEVASQLLQLVPAVPTSDASAAVALPHARHGLTNRLKTPGDLPASGQIGDRHHQHGYSQYAANGNQQQPDSPFVGGVGKRHPHCAQDLSLVNVTDCIDAHHVGGITEPRSSHPLLLTLRQFHSGLHSQMSTCEAAALTSLSAQRNDGVIHRQQNQALRVVRQGTNRVDKLSHVLDQGRIAIEQNTAYQHGIGTVYRQRKVRRRMYGQTSALCRMVATLWQ